MRRYLLDTNIVSNLVKPRPDAGLAAWIQERLDEELHVSCLSIGEIWRGILELPAGRRRRDLQSWFNGPDGPPRLFHGRILAFNQRAAIEWATLMARDTAQGTPRGSVDMMIAATARAHDCTIVTDNERDFEGFGYINPLSRR